MKYMRIPGLLCIAFALSGCVMVDLSKLGSSELSEVTVEKADRWLTADKILLVDVSGVIADGEGGLFGGMTCSPAYMKSVLRKAAEDDLVRAVVLRIDSPGGTVSASEVIAREVAAFRKKTGKPVFAQITGLGCSGAYYVAAPCTSIGIQPSGIAGSIGVIAVFPKYRKLADKVGLDQVVMKSGAMKDIGSGMRDMTDDERKVLQGMIDADYHAFLNWVVANRPQIGTVEQLKPIADGRIYTADQAAHHKLVDRVCFLDETLAEARKTVGLTDAAVVTYGYHDSPDANIYSPAARASKLQFNVNVPVPAPLATTPGFHYLWMPGE